MEQFIYKSLLMVDNTVNIISVMVSIVSAILSIAIEIKKRRKNGKEGRIWALLCIVSVLVIVGSVVRANLVVTPDVVGYTYQDACNVLSNNELKYTLVVNNGLCVTEQTPSAGTIIKKGTKVELITEPIGNNDEVRERWEKSLDVDYGNVEITFKEIDITLTRDYETIECFGEQIKEYNVKKAYLIEETSGVEYHNYVIQGDSMIFEEIPKGINFKFYVLLDGYEEAWTDVMISSQNTINNIYNFNLGIYKSEMDILLPTTFYVANKDGSSIMNVNYMDNIKMWVMWPYNNVWYGDYYTDARGRFEYSICINEDKKIKVYIENPFDNGNNYECEVTLHALKIGEPVNNDIIFLNKDGTCEVISESKYFLW